MPKRLLRSFSWLAIPVALAILVPAAGRAGKGPLPQFMSASFKQVNWLEAPGAPLQANSIWSAFEFGYKPVAKTWYLNGAVKLPGGRNEHWFLRNLPLFGERKPRARREAVFLDLRRLGLADGTDLKSVQAVFSLDTAPRKNSPPVASGSVLPVGDRDLLLDDALGLNTLQPLVPGAPRTLQISQAPKQAIREEKGDFVKWLKAEMAKQGNVQVLISFSGGRFAFILTGMFTEKGKTYVRFRFDDRPGDDLKGNEEDLVGEIFKGAGGAYFLVSDAWKIVGGVSDSVAKS